jgi:lysophospholipase L1-like esterase
MLITNETPRSGVQAALITRTGPVVVLGASYAAGWKVTSIAGVPLINRGVAGQQSLEMLERFDRDVAANHPRAVIIWGFINDFFRTAPQEGEQVRTRVRDNYIRMIATARRHGIEPILATEVTVRPPDTWSEMVAGWVGGILGKESYQDRINGDVLAANQALADLAKHERLLVLDFQAALAQRGGRRRREFTQDDGSHITHAGYAALTAYAIPILEGRFGGRESGS